MVPLLCDQRLFAGPIADESGAVAPLGPALVLPQDRGSSLPSLCPVPHNLCLLSQFSPGPRNSGPGSLALFGLEIKTLLEQIEHFISELDNIEKRDMVHGDNDNHPIPSDDDEQGPMPAVDNDGATQREVGGLNWREENHFWMGMDKLLTIAEQLT
jgi:hypothetical protein